MNAQFFKIVILFSSLIFSLPAAYAQWYYSVSAEQQYNSNPFRLPDGESDQVSQFSFGLQRDWNLVSAQYYGSFYRFNKNSPRNFYWHQFFFSGGDSTNWFLSMDNRINRTEYDIYDYLIFKGGVGHQVRTGGYLIRLGGAFHVNTYRNLEELNNLLFSGYISLNRSFQTRTSLLGAVSFNYKKYINKIYLETDITESETEISQFINYYPGNGGGPGYGGGRWRDTYYYYSQDVGTTSISQILLSLRIAQSITRLTGAAIQYYNRIGLSSQDRGFSGIIYGYDTESQIFDDPMGYEGQSVGLEITRILPFRSSVKTSVYIQKKNYISQGIYTDAELYDDTIAREDERKTIWVSLQKRFNLNLLSGGALTLHLDYEWLDNQSTSYWYNYQNHYFSGGIDFDF